MVAVDTFENLLSESNMNLSEVAKRVGIPKGQLSTFVTSRGKKTIDFMYYLRAIRLLKPDQEEKIMKASIPHFLRPKNLRIAMEYASTFNHFELQRVLYDINVGLGRENKDFADIYWIYLAFQEKSKPYDEIQSELDEYTPKSDETKVMKKIVQASLQYVKKDYQGMYYLSKEIHIEVSKIKTEFLRESYMARVSDLISRCYLFYKNDQKKARFFANNLEKNEFSANRRIHSHYIKAMSEFFVDYDKCLNQLREYQEELRQQGNNALAEEIGQKEIPFLMNFWKEYSEWPGSNDEAEMAYYFVQNGESEKALKILEGFDELSPFQLYYKGLAKEDPKLLAASFVEFMNSGNRFFANLPKSELWKYESYGFFADLLYNKAGNLF